MDQVILWTTFGLTIVLAFYAIENCYSRYVAGKLAREAPPLTDAQEARVRELVIQRLKLQGIEKLHIVKLPRTLSPDEQHVPNLQVVQDEAERACAGWFDEHLRKSHPEEYERLRAEHAQRGFGSKSRAASKG